MVQIIRGQESQSSIRQRALNDSLSGAINAWGDMEQADKKEAATQRQQALDLMKTTQALRTEGYDVNEEQVKQYLAPEKTQSFGDKLKGMFTNEQPEAQVRPDLYAKRTPEYVAKQEQTKATAELEGKAKKAELETKEYSLQELKEASPYKRRKMELENQSAQREAGLFDLKKQKLQADIGKTYADSQKAQREASQVTNGKQLSSTDVLKVNEGNAIPAMLKDVQQIIAKNPDSFGPVKGRLTSLNPYNEKAQTIESNIRASSQAFGRFMEGGVLRKEDEEKYAKMFPNLSDDPKVAANKLAIVEKLLIDRQNSSVQALRDSGYDISGVNQNLQAKPAPEVLGINGKINAQEIVNQVQSMSRADKIKLLKGGA